jgi:signal transduction histidine kinase
MSLVSRLSGFFLGAQAILILGFSSSLYVLASHHLHRQINERLDAALATLTAAAEVSPEGVEWDPAERDMGLGRDTGADQIRWIIRDDAGRTIDRSANLDSRDLTPPPRGSVYGPFNGHDGRSWQTNGRSLIAPGPISPEEHISANARQLPSSEAQPGPGYPALHLLAIAPLEPTEATLRRLALTLALMSTTLWLVSAVAGRRLCRRALTPLTRMAQAARSSDATDPDTRLPLPGTADELEDLGRAFNGLLDRLHETLERQRRFTGDASHQLRTPLAGRLRQVDVALRRERPPEEYQRVLGVVRTKAAQLRQIIESLLLLARAESESSRPELEFVDLAAWVSEHMQGWSNHPRAGDIRLIQDDGGPLRVGAQRSLLCQLEDNLLENACKYSEPGTPIELRLGRSPGLAALSVEDRGCGLTAQEHARIFQPFYRTPDARNRGQAGVGLGLAVADRIATLFGGSIRVESKPGEGSRFTVLLPEAETLAATPSLLSPNLAVTPDVWASTSKNRGRGPFSL